MTSEFASGAAFVVLAIIIAFGARELGLGTLVEPGPGLYPLFLAIALAVLSICLIISAIRRLSRFVVAPSPSAGRPRQLIATIATLVFYVALLPGAGLAFATVIFLALLFRIGGMRRWSRIAALSLLFGIGAELVCRFIGIPLPPGVLWQALLALEA